MSEPLGTQEYEVWVRVKARDLEQAVTSVETAVAASAGWPEPITVVGAQEAKTTDLVEALRTIRDYQAFDESPVAPRPTPTESRMRSIARRALESFR